VFSSSKNVSISQKCKRVTPKTGHQLFIAKGKQLAVSALVGGNERVGIQRLSLGCMPRVPRSQISNGRFYPTDASVAQRTQSSKLPNRAELHQTRPSLEHHHIRCLLQQRVSEGKLIDTDVSVRRSRDQHLSHREQRAPPRAKHQTRQLRLTPAKPASVAQKTATITFVTSPSVPSFGAMENKCFISTKMPESRDVC
jgi:hypothetical protein